WEFPPLTVPALLLLPLTHGQLGSFGLCLTLAMLCLEYTTLEVLRRAHPELARPITRWWNVLCLPLCAVAYFRLDMISVLPATAFVAAMSTGRRGRGLAVLGFAAKLWPALLLTLHAARRQWRHAIV